MPVWESYLAEHRQRFLDEYLDFLRIPSISAQPEHAADVARAGDWTAERLTAAGMQNVRVYPTGGHPVVCGEWLNAPGRPTVLLYGHFDVQPVDPLDLWTTPPFAPSLRDDRVVARGAADNKGNLFLAVQAVEALLRTEGRLPLNVKFFVEGQEEIGSPQLPDWVAANRALLGCDLVVSTDGGSAGADPPQLVLGCRGIVALQIDVVGPSSDLHSGSYGGAVQNPIHALVRLLDSMRNPDGRIAVEGFYDDVVPLTDADRALIARVPFDEAEYKRRLGVDDLVGETGYTPRERLWARPTLELNGIWGGYQGEGNKTVLPSEAHAKITCRLVPDQDPARVRAAIERHVERHAPRGVRVRVAAGEESGGARAYMMPADHPANQVAFAVLAELCGQEPYYARMGGTVPVYDLIQTNLGVECLSFGQGVGDERAHAPDEFFRLAAFDRGPRAYARLLARLGDLPPAALRR